MAVLRAYDDICQSEQLRIVTNVTLYAWNCEQIWDRLDKGGALPYNVCDHSMEKLFIFWKRGIKNEKEYQAGLKHILSADMGCDRSVCRYARTRREGRAALY